MTTTDSTSEGQTNELGLARVANGPISLEVSRELLRFLLSGDIKLGSRLPSERKLGELLGVGRNAIRDGLRPLMLLGVLEVRPGSGTYLRATTSDLLPQVIEWGLLLGEPSLMGLAEARLHIESSLARLAAERRTRAQLDALFAALRKMESAKNSGDADDFRDADLAFHLNIAEAAESEVLAGIIRNITTLIEVWIRRVTARLGVLEVLYAEHAAIMEAVDQQDSRVAAAAMENHLKIVTSRLRDGLEAEWRAAMHGTETPRAGSRLE